MDKNELRKLFLFKPDNIFMKTLEDTTQLGGFNKHLPMRNSNKKLPISGTHRNEDDAIDTFLSLAPAHDGTTTAELIFRTKTLITHVYAIG